MQVLLHRIPEKYHERLSEPDSGHLKKALKGLEKEPPEGNIVPRGQVYNKKNKGGKR
jgi:hypothetical protein